MLGIRRCNLSYIDTISSATDTKSTVLRGVHCNGGVINWGNMSVSDDILGYSESNKANSSSWILKKWR